MPCIPNNRHSGIRVKAGYQTHKALLLRGTGWRGNVRCVLHQGPLTRKFQCPQKVRMFTSILTCKFVFSPNTARNKNSPNTGLSYASDVTSPGGVVSCKTQNTEPLYFTVLLGLWRLRYTVRTVVTDVMHFLQAVSAFSQRQPGIYSRSIHAGFVGDKVALGEVCFSNLMSNVSPCPDKCSVYLITHQGLMKRTLHCYLILLMSKMSSYNSIPPNVLVA